MKLNSIILSIGLVLAASALPAQSQILFSQPSIFEDLAVGTTRSATWLTPTQFVVAYATIGQNSQFGASRLGMVSDNSIDFGADGLTNGQGMAFVQGSLGSIALTRLSEDQFIVAYNPVDFDAPRASARLGTASGQAIHYGQEAVFNETVLVSDTLHISAAALSSAQFVVAYEDQDRRSKVRLGTVLGNKIAFGPEVVFDSAERFQSVGGLISVTALSSSQFVVAYLKQQGSTLDCRARVGTVLDENISFGPELVFEDGSASGITATALAGSQFVVAYNAGGNGKVIAGTVIGGSISFGLQVAFNPAGSGSISAAALSATQFVVAYMDGGNSLFGTTTVGTVAGDSISFGGKVVFEAAQPSWISASALSASQFVVAFGRGSFPPSGAAVLGTLVP